MASGTGNVSITTAGKGLKAERPALARARDGRCRSGYSSRTSFTRRSSPSARSLAK